MPTKVKECNLIAMAKLNDKEAGRNIRRVNYSDEEIQLAVAWFEQVVSREAVAGIMGWDKGNVGTRCVSAIKQGLTSGRIGFIWLQGGEPVKSTQPNKEPHYRMAGKG